MCETRLYFRTAAQKRHVMFREWPFLTREANRIVFTRDASLRKDNGRCAVWAQIDQCKGMQGLCRRIAL